MRIDLADVNKNAVRLDDFMWLPAFYATSVC